MHHEELARKSIPKEAQVHHNKALLLVTEQARENYQDDTKPFSEYEKEISRDFEAVMHSINEKLALAKKLFQDHMELHDHKGFSHKKLLPIWKEITEQAKKRLKNPKSIDFEKTMQDEFQIPWEFMDRAYDIGKQCLFEGKNEEAESMFLFLCLFQPRVYEYWLGLATAQHVQKRWNEAILNYSLALRQQPTNPIPFFQIACCLLEMNEKKAAHTALQKSIEYATAQKSTYKSLLQEAEQLAHAIQNHKE